MCFTTCAESFAKLFEQLEGIDYISVDAQDISRLGGESYEEPTHNTRMLADTAVHD